MSSPDTMGWVGHWADQLAGPDLLSRLAQAAGLLDPSGLAAAYTTEQRLYHLEGSGSGACEGLCTELLVEAWSLHEALSLGFELRLTCLATDATLPIEQLLGQGVTLWTTLADGTRAPRSGLVQRVDFLHADGGLARFALTVVPWITVTQLARRSTLHQGQSTVAIAERTWGEHPGLGAWSWAPEVAGFVERSPWHEANSSGRLLCTQYRETDFDFVTRLLAEEGLGWCVEDRDEVPDAPHRHGLKLFADSTALPEDDTSVARGGLPWQPSGSSPGAQAGAQVADAVFAFGRQWRYEHAIATVATWSERHKRVVAASVASLAAHRAPGPAQAAESYRHLAAPWASTAAAQRAATLLCEAAECRFDLHWGRSSVRTLRPGRQIRLQPDARLAPGSPARWLVLSASHVGLNNLPRELSEALARRIGAAELPPLPRPRESWSDEASWVHDEGDVQPLNEHGGELMPTGIGRALREQVARTGYANAFTCAAADVPWRPQRQRANRWLHPRPQAPGVTTALVVGEGGRQSGQPELHTDGRGRIRVRFHWQRGQREDDTHTPWLRVWQLQAGAGMGWQLLPRIGQEVLVGFDGGDIDRPYVMAGLYNGKGEGGVPATPGGQASKVDTSPFESSTDHTPGGQGNLVGSGAGGHSPAWHGASPGAQAHAAAMSGIKSREFAGDGSNQLVLDDTPNQLRAHLASSQFSSYLTLGHLVHQADNHRGSFRGLGFELRTDAWGAVRGVQGVLLTSYRLNPFEPAGDNTPGLALARQMATQAQAFSDAAKTHQTVPLAAHLGSTAASKSVLSDQEAPLKALQTALGGVVDEAAFPGAQNDAGSRSTKAADKKLPHTADPILAVSAQAGLAATAGQAIQVAAGDTLHFGAGQDQTRAVGGASRLHTGQAIGILAGAIQPAGQSEAAGTGISLVAAQGDVEMQAQSGPMEIAAQGLVDIISANAHIDWAAAERIVLSTAGGARLVIDANGITAECPGKITIQAGSKSFEGAGSVQADLGDLPTGAGFQRQFVLRRASDAQPLAHQRYRVTLADGRVVEGTTNAQGETTLSESEGMQHALLDLLSD